tara:strand:- start:3070 stop:5199 length:2130 start_codon:yes stop_codon:yes gene_type:complete
LQVIFALLKFALLNNLFLIIVSSIIFFFLFLNHSYAQVSNLEVDSTNVQTLKEVIISATRVERQLSSLPLPATIISKKAISRSNSNTLNQILQSQTGLTTVPDFGGGEGLQMQGLDSQYTLILLNGSPLIGRSAGTFNLKRINLGNIRQIEIVKGASSSLYGSEALAGIINIVTEKPTVGFSNYINYSLSTYNSNDFSYSMNNLLNNTSFDFFFNRNSSDGYDLNENDELMTVDPFVNYTINASLTYDLKDKTEFYLSTRYYNNVQDNVASSSLKGLSEIDEWNTNFKINYSPNSKWDSFLELYLTNYLAKENLNNLDGSLYDESFYDHSLFKPELRNIYRISNNKIIVGGIGLSIEKLNRTYFEVKPIFKSPYIYIQYDYYPIEDLNLIIGSRFDSHNKYKSQFSPKLALRYKINEKISTKFSLGYGYKAPDFRQLYFDFTNSLVGYSVLGYNVAVESISLMQSQGKISNIIYSLDDLKGELKAENSISFNLGFNYILNSEISFDLNIFRNTIKDLIDTRVIANKTNGQNVFSYYNVNNVFTHGLEFNSKWNPSNSLTINSGFQLLYAKDSDAIKSFNNGEVYARKNPNSPAFQLKKKDYFGLFNRSRTMINININYDLFQENIELNLKGKYRSKYGIIDSNYNNFLDSYDEFVNGYALIDFTLNKKINKKYNVGFGIDNVFDFKDYQNITNISGRIFYAKLNLNFNQ